jgi:Tol biopolymer transport system component
MRPLLAAVALVLALAPPATATFPGRDGLLAVAGDGDSRDTTIWVGHPNGRGLRALPTPCAADPPGRCFAGGPAWSPDGQRLAFAIVRGVESQVWIVEADGTNLRQVPGVNGFDPAWSPDGRRLVVSVDRRDNQECQWRDLYTVGVDGSGLELLVRRGDDADWSARGSIVFERMHEHWTGGPASECEPRTTVAVLRPGERPRHVANGADPSWAPGGRAVAFIGRGGIRRKTVGAAGPGRLLVGRPLLVYEPTWSPDGRSILYRAATRLKRVAARTGRPLPLAFDAPGSNFQSSWQAR